ncbi:MAG: glycosyltransferase [Chloroflexi bacterium AL-W]|nr:glycosyltransferase [Chloroflexi bacterium AL-N1]NOK67274.1 glycosyltransferase [Chloroflexi bacterium AL-N10]NOK75232.1 glycosyltransferase [Chloroflexi bacterium AL-N5]NOK82020.1 glycosyltransferase [Chloroflexi bacterium AL-W]NOK89865.1 glycosyltransferase [Chloroflexi bacterium AL-N15]
MKQTVSVSLVCTVRDEADNIAVLLDSMLQQTRPPDEIVVNDCLSRDATPQIVGSYIARGHPIRLVRGGYNIPSGRNNAIRHAQGSIVACTDAGLTLDTHWLEHIIAPLERDQADIVGGFFRPMPQSLFELVLGATNYREAAEINPETFLPFGKSVAFYKRAWEHVDGYPEWVDHCEDVLFDLALKRAGYRFAFAPDALVLFRPRSSFAAFAKQYFLYARGDGMAHLWSTRHLMRYTVYTVGTGLLVLAWRHPWVLGLFGLGLFVYTRTPLRRLCLRGDGLTKREAIYTASLIPLIRIVGDVSKMLGYPVGLFRRFQKHL